MELPDDLPDNLDEIRQMQLNDRSLMDRATRAFVSYIHSYVKHECSVLLRVKGTFLRCVLPKLSFFSLKIIYLFYMTFRSRFRFRSLGRGFRASDIAKNARAEK